MTAPSQREGRGAVPFDGGVTFRVWAPFAGSVSVAGDFNGWSTDASPLAADAEQGWWSTDVDGAGVGHEYKFVLTRSDGTVLWRKDPYGRQVTNSAGNSVVVDPSFDWGETTDFEIPPWNTLIVYELHAGTFNDAPGGGVGGFDSVVKRLGYLQSLGINAIELLPAMEFAGDFSWGYNPSDIFAIESAYGGPAALKTLIRAAHEHRIAVLLDVVYNHFGPGDLDLWQFDGWNQNGHGGIYFYEDDRRLTPWGQTRPDYGRQQVRAFLSDNARMWLEEFRVDGLRWDATNYIRNISGDGNPAEDIADGWSLMQAITSDSRNGQPGKLHIAEDLQREEWLTRPVAEGGAGFGSQWDAGFVHPVRQALAAPDDAARRMCDIRDAILGRYGSDRFARVIYTESHDEVANGKTRLPTEIDPADPGSWYARKRSTLGAVLVCTVPGIPMIFQGQEILEDTYFRDDDPIDWTREQTYAGVLALYQDLFHLRLDGANARGLRAGGVQVHHVNDTDKLLAFHRWDNGGPGDDVVVLLNLSARGFDDYRIGLPSGGTWQVRLDTDRLRYSADYAGGGPEAVETDGQPYDGMSDSAVLPIAPYSAVILSQDAAP